MRRVRAMAAAAAMVALAAGACRAQPMLVEIAGETGSRPEEVRTVAAFGDWQVTCDGARCRMSTWSGAEAGSRRVAVELTGEPAASGDPIFVFRVPLDLLLTQGAELRPGRGEPARLAFRSCHAAGCLLPFRLDDRLRDRFRRDAAVGLRLFDLAGAPVDVELSLRGFSAALSEAGL